MPKKAPQADTIDPVRSRLAGAVAGPATPRAAPVVEPEPPRETKSEPEPVPAEAAPPKPSAQASSKPKPAPTPSAMTVNRKFMVSPQEADQIEQTLKLLKETFGSKVTLSQATRAMWTILAGSEDALRRAGRRQPQRTAPSTGNAMAMAEYEEEVAEFLEAVLKRV